MMNEQFPFLARDDIETTLELCERNQGLFYFPESRELLGFYRFYPELIYAVKDEDFELLMQCNLREGPLVYVAALIGPNRGALRTIRAIVSGLNARGYAFHRYKNGEHIFHFVRNNRFGRGARINYAGLQ